MWLEIVIGIMEMNLIYKDTVYIINQLNDLTRKGMLVFHQQYRYKQWKQVDIKVSMICYITYSESFQVFELVHSGSPRVGSGPPAKSDRLKSCTINRKTGP